VALAWIGWGLSLKEKVFGMLDIVHITNKQMVFTLWGLFKEYTRSLGKEDENDDLPVSIFTRMGNPGTLLLVAVKDNEFVGFLWAQPVSEFGLNYLRVSEIYARQGMMGIKLFERAIEHARKDGFDYVKGLVRAEKAEAMKRLFKAKEEAVLISVEVGYG